MIEGITNLTDFQAIITDQGDVGFYHPATKNIITLQDATLVKNAVDDEVAADIEYES